MKVTIPVSVGELLDKISILEIKSLFVDNEYVNLELQELTSIMNTITSCVIEEMENLRQVNRKLWKIEDQLRKLEKEQDFGDKFIELARSVYITNDERSQIKKRINEITNSSFREVKVY